MNAKTGWIGGPKFDAFFFFGGGLLALAAGLLMMAAPWTVLPLWFAWIWLIEGPHLFGTWQRAYLDPGYRRQHKRMLAISLLWFVPGPLLLCVSWLTGEPGFFLLFLGLVAIWSFHHAIRQHHGIQSIYQRLGGVDDATRKMDGRLLHGILWLVFVLFLLGHPLNRELIGLSPALGTGDMIVIAVMGGALALAVLAWAVMLLRRWRRGAALKAGVFGLVVAVGTLMFAFFVVGMREPLLTEAMTTEQFFMAATLVGGILHGIQYIGIVIATERRRALSGETEGSLSARFGKAPLLAYAVMLVASVLYVVLNMARGAAPFWAASTPFLTQLFLALYWGLFCHHFWLDQKIWKPSADARLRAELGLGTA